MISSTDRNLRSLPAALVAALALCACAQMPDGQRTRAEGAFAGAVGGAVVGKVLGRSNEAAAVGAVIGTGVGYVIGDNVANEKEQLTRNEDALQKVIADAQASTLEFQQVNADLKTQIQALDDRRRVLQSRRLSQRARQVEMGEQRKQAGALLARTQKETERLDDLLAQHRRAIADAQKSQASAELVPVALRQVDSLAAQRQALEAAKRQLELIDPRRVY